MLARIDLHHFKCFDRLKLPLKPLTLLSGPNASGKSSVMQALALLHQTMCEHEWSSRLMLNGGAIRLGTAAAMIDELHGRQELEISLVESDDAWYAWEFEGERNDMSLAVRSIQGETSAGKKWEWKPGKDRDLFRLLPYADSAIGTEVHSNSLTSRLRRLAYLTAERLGPREHYMLEDPEFAPVVGPQGENAISILHSGSDMSVLDGLAVEGVPPTLSRQVEERMRHFFPGCEQEIKQINRTNAVTLGIRMSDGTGFHRPTNAGFGLTQALPIIVAGLSVGKGDLLLIENPEGHLHPAGQAKMGVFLAEVAAAGVQVLLETHSDHVLNGIRRAVKGGVLACEDTALYFFRPRRKDSDGEPQVQSMLMNADGNIDSWPDGFFDQFDRDMNHFAGWD